MARILLAEDEPEIRENLVELLSNEGYTVEEAEDGLACVNLAQANPPDLILCDILMPEMDGHAVINHLRAEKTTENIPFIFLTAKGTRQDQRIGMDSGADDYLVKPFLNDELLNAIRSRLARVEKQRLLFKDVVERLTASAGNNALAEALAQSKGLCGFSELLNNFNSSLGRSTIQQISGEIQDSAIRLNSLLEDFAIRACVEAGSLDLLRLLVDQPKFCSLQDEATWLRRFSMQWGRVRDLNTKELNGELQLPSLVVKKLLEACTEAALISTSPGIPVHLKSVRRNDAHLTIWEWQTTSGQDLQISPTSAMSRGKYAQQVGALIGVELTLEFDSGRIICCWP